MQLVTRRDRQLLFGLAAIALALAGLTLAGIHSDLLLAAPALVFALPLLAGRYVGAERMARLAATLHATRRRRGAPSPPAPARRSLRALPRGGRLLAASLAVRPPPRATRRTA